MARPALATIEDLTVRLGHEPGDPAQAEARLADASAIVRAYAGVTWLDDSGALADVPDDIPGVVATMVERASLNPTGTTQEQAGPFSRSFGADAAQRLYLTKGEKLVVRAAAGRSSIGTLGTSRGEIESAPLYDYGAGDYVAEASEVTW